MDKKLFREIREKIGSQFHMALILNVSQGQISIWEKGYRPIPEEIAEKMNELKED